MDSTTERIFCNNCKNKTKHSPLTEVIPRNYSDEGYRHYESHQLFECLGCESVLYRIEENSDGCDQTEHGQIIPNNTYYPPATIRSRPKWISDLIFPFSVESGPINGYVIDLIHEIYRALQIGSLSLSAMGIRALLEHIMIKQCGDQGSFKKNIIEFEKAGLISGVQRNALDSVLEIGHAVMHRSHRPDVSQLLTALDITENIIESIYVVSKKGDRVTEGVPKRPKNK